MIHDNVSNIIIIIIHVRVRRALENHVQVSDVMDAGGGGVRKAWKNNNFVCPVMDYLIFTLGKKNPKIRHKTRDLKIKVPVRFGNDRDETKIFTYGKMRAMRGVISVVVARVRRQPASGTSCAAAACLTNAPAIVAADAPRQPSSRGRVFGVRVYL